MLAADHEHLAFGEVEGKSHLAGDGLVEGAHGRGDGADEVAGEIELQVCDPVAHEDRHPVATHYAAMQQCLRPSFRDIMQLPVGANGVIDDQGGFIGGGGEALMVEIGQKHSFFRAKLSIIFYCKLTIFRTRMTRIQRPPERLMSFSRAGIYADFNKKESIILIK